MVHNFDSRHYYGEETKWKQFKAETEQRQAVLESRERRLESVVKAFENLMPGAYLHYKDDDVELYLWIEDDIPSIWGNEMEDDRERHDDQRG